MPDWTLPALLAALLGAGLGAWLVARAARRRHAELSAALTAERDAEKQRAEQLRAEVDRVKQELAAEQARLQAQREATQQAERTFQSLASKALSDAHESFLNLAQQRLGKTEQTHAGELEKRKQAIEAMLKPLGDSLGKLQNFQQELESKRERAYGSLETHLNELKLTASLLGERSQALEQALRGSSQARGRWGEIVLRRLVEMAGMTEHCDFHEQTQDTQGLRPDMVVLLPNQGRIPIDAKVPLSDYDNAVRATEPDERSRHLKSHAAAVRSFVQSLGRKDYAASLEGRIDFTVLFVPAEPMLAAAFESDPELLEDALAKGILLATPVTLMALLKTVALYWGQVRLAENAQRIGEAAAEYAKRVRVFSKHLDEIGRHLDRSVKAFNKAVGSYDRSVLPQARRVDELGAGAPLPEKLSGVEQQPRRLAGGDGAPADDDPSPADDVVPDDELSAPPP